MALPDEIRVELLSWIAREGLSADESLVQIVKALSREQPVIRRVDEETLELKFSRVAEPLVLDVREERLLRESGHDPELVRQAPRIRNLEDFRAVRSQLKGMTR